jgi:hypothetical protein
VFKIFLSINMQRPAVDVLTDAHMILHVKRLLFLSDFNQNLNVTISILKSPITKLSLFSVTCG